MKKMKLMLLNAAAYLGALLFIFAFIFSVFSTGPRSWLLTDFLNIFAIILGIILVVFTFVYSHRAYHLFIGMFLIIGSNFIILLKNDVLSGTIYQWWPFLGIMVGLILFISGMYKYKKLKIGYVIPSITIFLLGCWLMLFSQKIIKVPFSTVALIGAPLFVVFGTVFIVTLFLMQQKYKNLVVQDDDSDSFDDDEIITAKPGE